MKTLTIFTPTYNRAHLLPQVFQSLQKQDVKDFVWLIVDDGSEDHTAETVKKLQEQAGFEIRYFYQKNQGKHIAINTGLRHTSTDFFLILDSDDQLMTDAIGKAKDFYDFFSKRDLIAAIVFPRFSIKSQSTKTNTKISFNQEIADSIELKKKFNISGEFDYLFKTEILKQYPFPQFPGEKFIKESLVYKRIDVHYKNLYVKIPIISGEYLEDGLSSDFRKLLEKNPKGAALAYLEAANDRRLSFEEQKDAFKNYWYFANLAHEDSALKRLLKVKNKKIIFNFIFEKLK